MIQKITSKKVDLPSIYLVENEADFNELPKGLPYIIGSKTELDFIRIFLEFQVLYKSCLKTGLPFNWLEVLSRVGYKNSNLRTYELHSGGAYWESEGGDGTKLTVDQFIQEQYLVNFDSLSELKILPVWLDDIKKAVQQNVIDEIQFNPLAFNKQLGLNVGAPGIKHNAKNLIIADVSGSIPNSIVIAITQLVKLMSKKFYADVMITGGKTWLYEYEKVQGIDFAQEAANAGRGNEGEMYAKIVNETKHYNTIICFGDDDAPDMYGGRNIKNKITVDTLYSLHTQCDKTKNLAGYCKTFTPKTTHKIKNWVTTLK